MNNAAKLKLSRRGRGLLLLVGLAILAGMAAGCCKMIPFKSCRSTASVRVELKAERDCNAGYPLETRFMILSNRATFESLAAEQFFGLKATETDLASTLGIRADKSVFVEPGKSDTLALRAERLNKSDSLYFCAVANFAEPGSTQSGRVIVPLAGRSSVKLQLNFGRDAVLPGEVR